MNYTEFVNAVKEKLTQELNGGVRVNVYTTKKNNATERTGLILETPGVNISPTIYLEEFFELYEKGKQMDWIIEDLVGLYEEIRQEKSWDYERMLYFEGVKDEEEKRYMCEEYGLVYVFRRGEKERIRRRKEAESITLKLF